MAALLAFVTVLGAGLGASGLLGVGGLATRGWAWGSLAPAIAALVLVALARARVPGFVDVVVVRLGVGLSGAAALAHVVRRVLLALGLGLVIVLMTMQLHTTVGLELPLIVVSQLPVPIGVLALGWLAACVVEEFGWRGVLQPTLTRAWGWRRAALVTGLVWAGSQWALLAQQRGGVEGVVFVLGVVVAAVAQSWLMAIMLSRMVRGQWAAAVALRWITGMGLLLVGNEETGSWQGMALVALACVITTAFCLWLDARRQLWRASGPATAPASPAHRASKARLPPG